MPGSLLPNQGRHAIGWSLAVAVLWSLATFIGAASLTMPARAEADVFQQAVNYIFTGEIDPKDPPEIVDRKSCIVELRDARFNRYIRYYLNRFKMDDALFDKRYSGSRVAYQITVKGDDNVVEYLTPDRKNVIQGYRSAEIYLPGDTDRTRKALNIVFTNYCKSEQPKLPF